MTANIGDDVGWNKSSFKCGKIKVQKCNAKVFNDQHLRVEQTKACCRRRPMSCLHSTAINDQQRRADFFYLDPHSAKLQRSLETAVWPDFGLKTCPIVLQKLPPKVTAVWLKMWWFSKLSKKSPNIWATFARKFVAKNFQKLPNLVTLLERERERESVRGRCR